MKTEIETRIEKLGVKIGRVYRELDHLCDELRDFAMEERDK